MNFYFCLHSQQDFVFFLIFSTEQLQLQQPNDEVDNWLLGINNEQTKRTLRHSVASDPMSKIYQTDEELAREIGSNSLNDERFFTAV